LRGAKIAIIGVGGVGALLVEWLALLGVGRGASLKYKWGPRSAINVNGACQ